MLHFGTRPWDNVMISGFVMANKGEKISKSKGNSKIEPMDLINEYSADVLRYWAGTGRLGTDIVFSDETLLRGKKLVNKIWNVSKFIEMHLQDYEDKEFTDFEYIDKWILGKYQEMEKQFIKYLDDYEVGLNIDYIDLKNLEILQDTQDKKQFILFFINYYKTLAFTSHI